MCKNSCCSGPSGFLTNSFRDFSVGFGWAMPAGNQPREVYKEAQSARTWSDYSVRGFPRGLSSTIAINQPHIHTITYTMVAQVQKQAPTFKKTAVVDGVFDEVSLDKYKGKYVVLALSHWPSLLSAQLKSLPSPKPLRSSKNKVLKFYSPPLTPNTPFWHGPTSQERKVVWAQSTSHCWPTPTTPCPETTVS